MRKLIVLGLVAVAALALAPQQASAWHNIKLGAGFQFHWQSAGNSLGKHWHNGHVPGPGFGGGYGGPGFGAPPVIILGQEHHDQHQSDDDSAQGISTQANPFHYSSHQTGYYQEPGYYYGQNYWYGW